MLKSTTMYNRVTRWGSSSTTTSPFSFPHSPSLHIPPTISSPIHGLADQSVMTKGGDDVMTDGSDDVMTSYNVTSHDSHRHGLGGILELATPYTTWQVALLAVAAGSTSLMTIGGNIIVLLSFFLERSIRQPSNYFIASLAVSDLLIGVCSMPLYTTYILALKNWPLGEVLTIVFLTWIIPVSVFFTSIFGWQYFTGNRTVPDRKCYVQYMEDALFNCLLQVGYFWITLTAMFGLYAGIYRVALDLHRRSAEKRKQCSSSLATMAQKTVGHLGTTAIMMTRNPLLDVIDPPPPTAADVPPGGGVEVDCSPRRENETGGEGNKREGGGVDGGGGEGGKGSQEGDVNKFKDIGIGDEKQTNTSVSLQQETSTGSSFKETGNSLKENESKKKTMIMSDNSSSTDSTSSSEMRRKSRDMDQKSRGWGMSDSSYYETMMPRPNVVSRVLRKTFTANVTASAAQQPATSAVSDPTTSFLQPATSSAPQPMTSSVQKSTTVSLHTPATWSASPPGRGVAAVSQVRKQHFDGRQTSKQILGDGQAERQMARQSPTISGKRTHMQLSDYGSQKSEQLVYSDISEQEQEREQKQGQEQRKEFDQSLSVRPQLLYPPPTQHPRSPRSLSITLRPPPPPLTLNPTPPLRAHIMSLSPHALTPFQLPSPNYPQSHSSRQASRCQQRCQDDNGDIKSSQFCPKEAAMTPASLQRHERLAGSQRHDVASCDYYHEDVCSGNEHGVISRHYVAPSYFSSQFDAVTSGNNTGGFASRGNHKRDVMECFSNCGNAILSKNNRQDVMASRSNDTIESGNNCIASRNFSYGLNTSATTRTGVNPLLFHGSLVTLPASRGCDVITSISSMRSQKADAASHIHSRQESHRRHRRQNGAEEKYDENEDDYVTSTQTFPTRSWYTGGIHPAGDACPTHSPTPTWLITPSLPLATSTSHSAASSSNKLGNISGSTITTTRGTVDSCGEWFEWVHLIGGARTPRFIDHRRVNPPTVVILREGGEREEGMERREREVETEGVTTERDDDSLQSQTSIWVLSDELKSRRRVTGCRQNGLVGSERDQGNFIENGRESDHRRSRWREMTLNLSTYCARLADHLSRSLRRMRRSSISSPTNSIPPPRNQLSPTPHHPPQNISTPLNLHPTTPLPLRPISNQTARTSVVDSCTDQGLRLTRCHGGPGDPEFGSVRSPGGPGGPEGRSQGGIGARCVLEKDVGPALLPGSRAIAGPALVSGSCSEKGKDVIHASPDATAGCSRAAGADNDYDVIGRVKQRDGLRREEGQTTVRGPGRDGDIAGRDEGGVEGSAREEETSGRREGEVQGTVTSSRAASTAAAITFWNLISLKAGGGARWGTGDSSALRKSHKQQKKNENRARKALRTITVILGAFVLCWTPWHVLSLIMGFCHDSETCVAPVLYDISYWLCYLNSPLNPFCYAFANQQFKKTFIRILRLDWHRA